MRNTTRFFIDIIKALNIDLGGVIDIGAFKGAFSSQVSSALNINKENFLLVEPNKDVDLSGWRNIKAAVSNYNGNATFKYVIEESDVFANMSTIMDRVDQTHQYDGYDVSVVTGAELVNSVDFTNFAVCIDAEGHSYEVIEGFGDSIHEAKCIFVEVEDKEFWHGQKLKKDVENLLRSKGFVKHREFKTWNNQYDQFWINSNL